jgi:hypothetical protein
LNFIFFEWHKGLNQLFGMGWGSQIIDKSFGFDTAVEEAQRAINAAHVEAESTHNGVGLVKLMGRYSGGVPFLHSNCVSLVKNLNCSKCALLAFHKTYGMGRSSWYQD